MLTTNKKYSQIKNTQDIKLLLEKEDNSYTQLILANLDYPLKKVPGRELHHIYPKHNFRGNEKWNFVSLSYTDHTLAHELGYEAYKQMTDRSVARSSFVFLCL